MAALLSLSRSIVFGYIIVRMTLLWTIIDYEPIVGSYNAWTALGWNTGEPSEDEAMCHGDPDYNFWPENIGMYGGNMATNFSCPVLRASEVFRQAGDEVQVATCMWLHSKHNPPECRKAPAWPTARDEEYANFTRDCTRNYFVRQVEKLPIWIIHSVSGLDYQLSDMDCKIVPPEGSTSVPKYRTTNTSLTNGVGWQTNLEELLHFAGGYTLDSHNRGNDAPMFQGTPRLRLTGFILTLRFQYWNYASASGKHGSSWSISRPSEPLCELTVELQKTAWGFTGGIKVGNDIVMKNVARIKMVSEGSFGAVDGILVVSSLVEGFVLLGFASVLTREIAKLLYKDNFRNKTEIVYTSVCPLATLKAEEEKQKKEKDNKYSASIMHRNEVITTLNDETPIVPRQHCSDSKDSEENRKECGKAQCLDMHELPNDVIVKL